MRSQSASGTASNSNTNLSGDLGLGESGRHMTSPLSGSCPPDSSPGRPPAAQADLADMSDLGLPMLPLLYELARGATPTATPTRGLAEEAPLGLLTDTAVAPSKGLPQPGPSGLPHDTGAAAACGLSRASPLGLSHDADDCHAEPSGTAKAPVGEWALGEAGADRGDVAACLGLLSALLPLLPARFSAATAVNCDLALLAVARDAAVVFTDEPLAPAAAVYCIALRGLPGRGLTCRGLLLLFLKLAATGKVSAMTRFASAAMLRPPIGAAAAAPACCCCRLV